MTPELLAKYARPVPRYTSYPTAPHFSAAVGPERYRGWLEALPETPLSLYLHIPFCRALCWFCGCCTQVVHNERPVERYLELLLAETALVAEALGPRRPVGHIHLGGGTPTVLSAGQLRRLGAALRERFAVQPDAEFAIEIDPRVLAPEQAQALGAIGVTRASLGVQDFAPLVQKAINRIQTYEATARAASLLREHGIGSLNLDLLYGLPHQTVASVAATVERALSLAPDRLALFGYAHVPWMKRHQQLIATDALPDAAERHAQAETAARLLAARGYVAVGLDHFARADDALAAAGARGTLRRNFQGYTTDRSEALIGLGASAIGRLPQGYVQNAAAARDYAAALGEGRLATVRGLALEDEDRLRGIIIEQLMCRFEAPIEALREAHGHAPGHFAVAYRALAPMVADGLVRCEEGHVRVTAAGRPLVRAVAAAFDRYLAPGEARHSIAV